MNRRKLSVIFVLVGATALACGGSSDGGSSSSGSPFTTEECATYAGCSVDTPCASGNCASVAGCMTAICIDPTEACEKLCGGQKGCAVLESFPEQIVCETEESGGGPVSCDDCNLPTQLPALAGARAKDCGTLAIEEDPTAARQCIEEALAAGRAFRVSRSLQGTDSIVIRGWVGDSSGMVTELLYDSNICGGGGSDCSSNMGCGPRISSSTCTGPTVGTESNLIDCADSQSAATICEPDGVQGS